MSFPTLPTLPPTILPSRRTKPGGFASRASCLRCGEYQEDKIREAA